MRIAVVVVNYRTPALTVACLRSLTAERTAVGHLWAVIVDNASGDDCVAVLSETVAQPEFSDWVEFMPLALNGGFGWGNNQAILHLLRREPAPDAILLLNPDARVEPGAVAALVADMARRPDAGAIGGQLLNEDGTLAGSAFRFPSIGREFLRGCGVSAVGRLLGIKPTLVPYGERGPVDWVTGACVLLRTQALREAGLFDTGFFLYFEEVELMHRLRRKGWLCYHCPESRVVHMEGASTGVTLDQDQRPPPRYMFESRDRYFTLAGGRGRARAAILAWLGGARLGRILSTLARRPFPRATLIERKALRESGVIGHKRAVRPAVVTTAAAPGDPPAWMQAREGGSG